MRLLIYALESSGASLFCYFLGQRQASVAVVDVWSRCLIPRLPEVEAPIVAKVTANTTHLAADHISNFRPDKVLLFIRDPVVTFTSLIKYRYANRYGSIEEKFRLFDAEYQKLARDLVIRYEDFVNRDPEVISCVNAAGWACSSDYYNTARSTDEIYEFNCKASEWLREHFRSCWGFGNIKEGPIGGRYATSDHSPETIQKVIDIAPRLSRFYGYC